MESSSPINLNYTDFSGLRWVALNESPEIQKKVDTQVVEQVVESVADKFLRNVHFELFKESIDFFTSLIPFVKETDKTVKVVISQNFVDGFDLMWDDIEEIHKHVRLPENPMERLNPFSNMSCSELTASSLGECVEKVNEVYGYYTQAVESLAKHLNIDTSNEVPPPLDPISDGRRKQRRIILFDDLVPLANQRFELELRVDPVYMPGMYMPGMYMSGMYMPVWDTNPAEENLSLPEREVADLTRSKKIIAGAILATGIIAAIGFVVAIAYSGCGEEFLFNSSFGTKEGMILFGITSGLAFSVIGVSYLALPFFDPSYFKNNGARSH